MKHLFLAFAFSLLAACASTVEYKYIDNPLSMPPKPTLPNIEANEMSCLSDETYKKLVKRDLLLQQHIAKLRLIISSTQGNKNGHR